MEGTVLANRYRLVAKLGDGAMGSVWQAEDLTLQRQVAIKLIKPAYAESAEAIERFQREARAAARLHSTHIITIHDYGIDEKIPFIVMELLEGESLSARLHRFGALSPRTTAEILSQVAEALSVAHDKGVIHRDLKPDNIFIVRELDKEVVKVLDFGIAKTVDELASHHGGLTSAGELLGTPYYMSPEQMLGKKDVGPGLDIWALGIIAYECLVGAPPLQGETVGAILNAICSSPLPTPSEHASVPRGFDEWFARAAAREASERYVSAQEATRALTDVCRSAAASDSGVAAAAVNSAPLSEPPFVATSSVSASSRTRLMVSLALGLVLVLTALGAVFAFRVLPRTGDVVVAVTGPTRQQVDSVLVFIDGQKRCEAVPCVVRGLLSGRAHFIRVRAPGFAHPADLPIKLRPGVESHVNIRLLPESGIAQLRVTSETSGLTLWLDGKEIGPLPQDLKGVPAGEHELKVGGNSRYETHTERFVLSDNEQKTIGPVQLKVVHGLATLELGNNADGARVSLVSGGQRCELTRLPARVDIGTDEPWELVASKRGYADYEVPLMFARGKAEKTFRIDLHRPDELVSSTAANAPGTPAIPAPMLDAPAGESIPTNTSSLALAALPLSVSDAGSAQPQPHASTPVGGEHGTLNINCIPVANVLVDGRPLGSTPKLGVRVAAGKHLVVFAHPDYGRKAVTIDVVAGGTATAAVRFP